MASSTIKNQIDTLLADNTEGGISAADLRNVLNNVLTAQGGHSIFYNSAASQSGTAGVPLRISNDGLGAGTETSDKPFYMAGDLWESNEVKLGELDNAAVAYIRAVMEIETLANNQEITLYGLAFDKNNTQVGNFDFQNVYYKATGSRTISTLSSVHVNPILSDGGYVELWAKSGSDFNLRVDNIFIDVKG